MTSGVVMSKVTVLVAVSVPSVAVTTTTAELAEVGVPENRPVVVSKLKPTGGTPPGILKLVGVKLKAVKADPAPSAVPTVPVIVLVDGEIAAAELSETVKLALRTIGV